MITKSTAPHKQDMEADGQTKVEVEDATLETIDMVNQQCLEVGQFFKLMVNGRPRLAGQLLLKQKMIAR